MKRAVYLSDANSLLPDTGRTLVWGEVLTASWNWQCQICEEVKCPGSGTEECFGTGDDYKYNRAGYN